MIEQKSGRPSFRTTLVDVITNVGKPIEMTCELIGDPQPSVIWKLNGHQFFSSDRITVSKSISLNHIYTLGISQATGVIKSTELLLLIEFIANA